MKSTIKIEGLRELEAALSQFTKATQRRVLERVLKKAAKPIEAAAKQAAPVDTGELKRSIKTTVLRTNAGKAAFAEAMRGGASRKEAARAAREANRAAKGQGASAVVRVQAKARHAIFAEFGTVKMAAQPFMGPAFRSKSSTSLASIRDDLKAEIATTAARIAKRNARKG